jgi:hypothetical protein
METYVDTIYQNSVGTTKTIVRTMGKNGPAFMLSAQVFCIVLILVRLFPYHIKDHSLTIIAVIHVVGDTIP